MRRFNLPDEFLKFLAKEVEPVLDAFLDAEKIIKEVELTDQELIIPSINELRYAGRQLLVTYKCIQDQEDVKIISEELIKAKNNCHIARYDAYQAALYYYIEKINRFREEYKYYVISDIIENYIDHLLELGDALEFIGINSHSSQQIDFEGLEKHFFNLKRFYKKTTAAREDLNKKISADQKTTKRVVLVIGLTILAILVSILIAVLS